MLPRDLKSDRSAILSLPVELQLSSDSLIHLTLIAVRQPALKISTSLVLPVVTFFQGCNLLQVVL